MKLLLLRMLVVAFVANSSVAAAQDQPVPPETPPKEPPITELPSVKTMVEATYPAKALEDRVEADVVLEIDIDVDGAVESANVIELTVRRENGEPLPDGDMYDFGQAATIAVTQIEFNPAKAGDLTVPVRIKYTYKFRLPAAPDSPPPDDSPPPPDDSPPPPPAKAKPVVNFRGTLLERGSRTPLAGITVTVYRGEGESAQGFEAVSDPRGKFKFYNLAPGEWNVLIAPDGYYNIKTKETMAVGELVEAKYYVEKKSYNPYDVTIRADRPRKEVNRRTLTIDEIVRIPGTLGDPVLVVENLPGVARPPPGLGLIIVRGSGPEDTGIYIDGMAVPLIYHFGGLKSVVPASVVGSVDFYPGNYSVEYGRAMGGIFDLHLKKVDPDRVHGSVDVSVLDTALYLEAPITDELGILLAARRSYVDFILDAVIPDDANIALTSAPRYWDYQGMLNWRPRPGHEFRALVLGSDDVFRLLFDDVSELAPGLESGSIDTNTNFQRLLLEHRYAPTDKFKNDLKFSLGRTRVDFNFFDTFIFDFNVKVMQLRDKATWKLSDKLDVSAGFDTVGLLVTGEVQAPRPPDEGEPDPEFDPDDLLFSVFADRPFLFLAPFVEATMRFNNLELVPGVRADFFSRTREFSVDPRVVARYKLGDFTAKGGIALVHQEATPQETDDVFGNPDLELQKALQYSVGIEWRPRDHLKFDVTVFYKDMTDLTSRTGATTERDGQQVPVVYDNGGTGKVIGAEVFLEHKFAYNFHGWLSYTFSRAERTDSGETASRLFDFDQTHILAVVGSYRLPRNWEIGMRWRLVSGNPTTPVIGATFVDALDEYVAIFGEPNSGRLPMFQQVDLRVDKTFVFDTWKLSAYLSLINATNNENVEAINYNYDYTEEGSINGLPILPILGIKGAW